MVKYKHIIKAIEEDINKSHQHLLLPKTVRGAFNKFHEQTCGKKIRRTEKAGMYDENGNEIFTKNGGKHSVSWGLSVIPNLYDEHGYLHITHNHPKYSHEYQPEVLSWADVDVLFTRHMPYGIRPDGSEGYLDEVFPVKSVSCETADGSRMSLIRGDKFKYEDANKVHRLCEKLEEYHGDYVAKYYKLQADYFDKYHSEDFNNWNEYSKFIHNKVINDIGVYERNPEFKEIQKEIREYNCRLEYTRPYDKMEW